MFDKLDHLQYLRYLKSIQNNRSHLITSLAFLVICKFTRLFSVSSNFLFMITQRWLDISFLLFPVGFNFCYKVSIFSIFILIDDNAVLFLFSRDAPLSLVLSLVCIRVRVSLLYNLDNTLVSTDWLSSPVT